MQAIIDYIKALQLCATHAFNANQITNHQHAWLNDAVRQEANAYARLPKWVKSFLHKLNSQMINTYTIRILWGSLTHDKCWEANPNLLIPEAQQLHENMEGGLLPESTRLTLRQVRALLEYTKQSTEAA